MRRRDALRAAAAGALALALPARFARAQSEVTVKLLGLPRIALLVGNSRYREAPLKNPANDVRALDATLSKMGFNVTTRLDADRAGMQAAIEAYTAELAAKRCVGLFYYAGHGVQLAWRNYMLPVEAEIDSIEQVQQRAVEVNRLMEGLGRAANPLNVVILDACRDNPFGSVRRLAQQGLSQMDAPPNTLLAYATAPGNVAADGEGENGLYTEHLLKEMRVAEAKIEDVFKRVRLAVRHRRSAGRQIPWESTSLEEDFWFLPPKELVRQSEEQRARRFEEEVKFWASVESSTDPAQIAAYLERYPSGEFAERAQAQLERALARAGERRIEVAPQDGNPFTKGVARADTAFRVGDLYHYRVFDLFTRQEEKPRRTVVTAITDTEVVYNDGALTTDLLGNITRRLNGARTIGGVFMPAEYALGRRWSTRHRNITPQGGSIDIELTHRVSARERLKVPAGEFDCFKIEAFGWGVNRPLEIRRTSWMAPGQVRREIAMELLTRVKGQVQESWRAELSEFKQG